MKVMRGAPSGLTARERASTAPRALGLDDGTVELDEFRRDARLWISWEVWARRLLRVEGSGHGLQFSRKGQLRHGCSLSGLVLVLVLAYLVLLPHPSGTRRETAVTRAQCRQPLYRGRFAHVGCGRAHCERAICTWRAST